MTSVIVVKITPNLMMMISDVNDDYYYDDYDVHNDVDMMIMMIMMINK